MKKIVKLKPMKQINTQIDFEINNPKKKAVLKVIALVLLVFIVTFPSLRLLTGKSTLKTQIAVQQTIYKTIDVEAFVVRKEVPIDNVTSGTIVPAVPNCSKVAIGEPVANVFLNEKSAENSSRIDELKKEIDYYTEISSGSVGTLQTDIEVYNSGVNNAVFELSSAVDNNDLAAIYELSREVREAVTKKQIVTGVKVDVSDVLTALTIEYDALKADSVPDAGIVAPTSGYYVNSVDSFENVVDYSHVKDLTCSEVDSILEYLDSTPASVNPNSVGKIISDFNWYLVCNTTIDALEAKTVDLNVMVIFGNSQVDQISMKIERINVEDGTDNVTLILSSNLMNEDIAQLRKVPVKIRVGSVTGIAVDRMALRTVDGEKGVYVKVGNLVDFKAVEILYNDDTMVLVKKTEDDDFLEVYDEVILEGSGLYAAKLLN